MKHNLHCTCPQCGKTGMTITEQAAFCNGKGQRLIGMLDNPAEVATIDRIESQQLWRGVARQTRFGNDPR